MQELLESNAVMCHPKCTLNYIIDLQWSKALKTWWDTHKFSIFQSIPIVAVVALPLMLTRKLSFFDPNANDAIGTVVERSISDADSSFWLHFKSQFHCLLHLSVKTSRYYPLKKNWLERFSRSKKSHKSRVRLEAPKAATRKKRLCCNYWEPIIAFLHLNWINLKCFSIGLKL